MIVRLLLLATTLVVSLQTDGVAPAYAQAVPTQDSSATPQVFRDEPATPAEALRRANDFLDMIDGPASIEITQSLMDQYNAHVAAFQKLDPDSAWLDYLHARSFAMAGRRMDAAEHLRKFVDSPEGRNEWRAHRLLGDAFVAEFPRLAKGSYDKALQLNPNEPGVLYGLSVCTYKLGDATEAVRLARESVAADGRKTIRYVANLASLLQATGDLGGALREARASLDLALAQVAEKSAGRADLLFADGQYGLTLSILQARTRAPGDPNADDFLHLARLIHDRAALAGRLAQLDVVAVLESGVERTPDTPAALLEAYAVSLAAVGRANDARRVFERLLEVDPTSMTATEGLRRLDAASTTPGRGGGP